MPKRYNFRVGDTDVQTKEGPQVFTDVTGLTLRRHSEERVPGRG